MDRIVGIPEGLEDREGLSSWLTTVVERNTARNRPFLNAQYLNVLAYYGIQWIVYDVAHQTMRPRSLKKWVPKPVTNKFASVLRPITSVLSGVDPPMTYTPVSDQPQDTATAGVAARLWDIAKEEAGAAIIRPQLARWITLTGNAWVVSGYDNDDKYGTVEMGGVVQCPICGGEFPEYLIEQSNGCPTCLEQGNEPPIQPDTGQPGFSFERAMGDGGQPKVATRPRGALYAEVSNLFEMEYDHEAGMFDDSPYKIRIRSRPLTWVEQRFGSAEGVEIGESGILSLKRRYIDSLAYISPTAGAVILGGHSDEQRTTVCEAWVEPCRALPQGLYGVVAGLKTMYTGPFNFHTMSGRPMCPITHFGYEYAPGRVAFKTVADDLLPKQRTRNELESIKILHSKRAANSITFIPDGLNTTKFTGEEGLIVRYNALAGVPPPSRQPGLDTPRTLDEYILQIDAELEEMSGAVDVLRGEAPAGVSAYVAISLLEQKAQQGLSELRTNWFNSWAKMAGQLLGIFKEYGIDERTHSFLGANGTWAMQQFTNADLRGAVQIRSEVTPPMTAVSKRAAYDAGVRMGLSNLMDPQERFKGWTILGLPEMMKDMEVDVQAAAKENDKYIGVFMRGEQPPLPQVRPLIDNHPIHLNEHRHFALSDNYEELPSIGKLMFDGHMAQHMAAFQTSLAPQQGQGKAFAQEGAMARRGAPSEGEQATSEGGGASQPARQNALNEEQ